MLSAAGLCVPHEMRPGHIIIAPADLVPHSADVQPLQARSWRIAPAAGVGYSLPWHRFGMQSACLFCARSLWNVKTCHLSKYLVVPIYGHGPSLPHLCAVPYCTQVWHGMPYHDMLYTTCMIGIWSLKSWACWLLVEGHRVHAH